MSSLLGKSSRLAQTLEVSKSKPAETRKSRKARTAVHHETYDVFLAQLIKTREEVGLSQREVCDRMDMPNSFLSKCEIGERRVDVMQFLQPAQIYGKPLNFFPRLGSLSGGCLVCLKTSDIDRKPGASDPVSFEKFL